MPTVYKKPLLSPISESIVNTVGDGAIANVLIIGLNAAPVVGPGMIIGYSYAGSNNKISGTLLGGVAQIALIVALMKLVPKEISKPILTPLNALYFDTYEVTD